jgi:hypothetical protein
VQGLGKTSGEKDHMDDIGIDRKVIFKLIFKKYNGGRGMD